MSSRLVARLRRLKEIRRDARRLDATRAREALNQATAQLNALTREQTALRALAAGAVADAIANAPGGVVSVATIEAARARGEQLALAAGFMDGRIARARGERDRRAALNLEARRALLAAENAVTRAEHLMTRLIEEETAAAERHEEVEIEDIALLRKPMLSGVASG